VQLTKTQQAVIRLLLQADDFLDAESIYLQLNATAKTYSYASVYNAVRLLHHMEVLISKRMETDRKRFFFLDKAWVASHIFLIQAIELT